MLNPASITNEPSSAIAAEAASALQRRLTGIWILVSLSSFLTACSDPESVARPPSYQGPEIVFDSHSYDFGESFLGHKKTRVFKFTNVGKERLEITDVKRECGCLVPEFSSKSLAPGEDAEMKVVFSPPLIGSILKRIRIYSNDSYQRESIIELKADCLGVAQLTPQVMQLNSDIPPGGSRHQLHLRVDPSESVESVRFQSDCSFLSFRVTNGLNSSSVAIELTIFPPPDPGPVNEKVLVDVTTRTVSGKPRRFAIPIPFQVRGNLTPTHYAEPGLLYFGVHTVDARPSKVISLKGAVDAPVSCSLSRELEKHVNVEPVAGNQGHFRLSVKEGPAGRYCGLVHLRWEGGGLSVPVWGARLP